MSIHKVTRHWTQKTGEKIRICDMTDVHLTNTINMLQRKAKMVHASEIEACASISFQGEMAQWEQDKFLNSEWDSMLPDVYQYLEEDAKRRGLDIFYVYEYNNTPAEYKALDRDQPNNDMPF